VHPLPGRPYTLSHPQAAQPNPNVALTLILTATLTSLILTLQGGPKIGTMFVRLNFTKY